MHPILFEIFGFAIPAFGAMMAAGFIVALLWCMQRAKTLGEDPDIFLESGPILIISAIVGARLCYFLFFPESFLKDPVGAILSRGGLVWYGGMVGVIAATLVFTRIKKIPFLRFADIIAPPAALGLALGRVGCFLAGCCYGGPCNLPWAVTYPAGHETFPQHVHPAPIYESLAAALLASLLIAVGKRFPQVGVTSWAFVVGYGIIRFLIEYARGDRLIWLQALDLSASQCISLLGVAVGVVMLIRLSGHRNKVVSN